MDIKDRIVELMERLGMSQKEFAEAINMSQGSLSSIVVGRTRPTNNHTLAIHRAFPKVNINWLLFGEGSMFTDDGTPTPTSPSLFGDSSEPAPAATSPASPDAPADDDRRRISEAPGYTYPQRDEPPLTKIEYVKRNVEEIRVFFDDGTYETFVPSDKK